MAPPLAAALARLRVERAALEARYEALAAAVAVIDAKIAEANGRDHRRD